MSVNLQGALRNFRNGDNGWKAFTGDDGKPMTKRAVLAELEALIAKGHRLMRCCSVEECPNFDFQTGCPGHEVVTS